MYFLGFFLQQGVSDFQRQQAALHLPAALSPFGFRTERESRGHGEGEEGGGGSGGVTGWVGGGILGVQALEISVVCFSPFQDGRDLEIGLEFQYWGGVG